MTWPHGRGVPVTQDDAPRRLGRVFGGQRPRAALGLPELGLLGLTQPCGVHGLVRARPVGVLLQGFAGTLDVLCAEAARKPATETTSAMIKVLNRFMNVSPQRANVEPRGGPCWDCATARSLRPSAAPTLQGKSAADRATEPEPAKLLLFLMQTLRHSLELKLQRARQFARLIADCTTMQTRCGRCNRNRRPDMSARNFEAPPGLPAALRRVRSAGKPCAADSACWGCTSVAGWKPKKTTNRRTDSLPCLGRIRASGWGDPPWVDSWATASKAASERLPSPAIICSGMSCRCGKWRSVSISCPKTRKNRVRVAFRSNAPDEDSAHISLALRLRSPRRRG